MININCCSEVNSVRASNNCGSYIPKTDKYSFENETCKKNDVYYGKIINWTKESIIVEVDNDNKYMKGQIIEFKI